MGKSARIYLSPPHMSGRELDYIRDVFESGWIAPVGPHLNLFEERFAERVGVNHALAVSSGTAALHLSLRMLDVKPGQEVLCSTLTFCASANPIAYENAVPVFIDSDRLSWNMDPNLLESELVSCRNRGRLPRAIIVVDILGQSADMDAISEIAERFGVPVIEDAAEALGASYKGKPAGSSGWTSVFSFNGNKIITTSGGGMLCSNDKDVIERARYLSTQAREPGPLYLHNEIGYNYRLSNVLAAVGLAQLEVLDERVAACRRNDSFYREHLQIPGLEFMPKAKCGDPNCWLTVMIVNNEFGLSCEEVRQGLERHNIESRRVWLPMHKQPAFSGARCRGGAVSEEVFDKGLCLPSGTDLSSEDLARVTEVIRGLRK